MVDPVDPEERDALAAELALGLLDGEERAAALRLALAQPDFAAAVEAWSLRMAPLMTGAPSVTPPAALWDGIAARVGAGGEVVRRMRLWRGMALLSTGIAAALALFIVTGPLSPSSTSPSISAVARLASENGANAIGVAYDPAAGELRLAPPAVGARDKSPELWVIPADGVPRSLGLVRPFEPVRVAAALRPLMRAGATLAVTMENPAGAPHAAPTSAPVLAGKILKL